MFIDKRWQRLTPEQWDAFARDWLAVIRESAGKPENVGAEGAGEETRDPGAPLAVGDRETMMEFTSRPEEQWAFIRAAMARAETDDELGAIAAGPVEHLLGWHGAEAIDQVEQWAANDAKVARMLTGVWST